MLKLEEVTKTFQLDENTTITPVNRVSLDVERGGLVIVVGRSGSGKTTLLNLAAGLVKPTAGRVTVNGRELAGLSDRELSRMRSRDIGFVFQFPSLLPALTILENVSLPSIFNPVAAMNHRRERAAELLGTVGLSTKLNVHPAQLSAGEQKRVVIARALINNPGLVLADEPTSDLDQYTETQIMDMICSINATGVTFLVVTHNRKLLPLAGAAYEMENGILKPVQPD